MPADALPDGGAPEAIGLRVVAPGLAGASGRPGDAAGLIEQMEREDAAKGD